MPNQTSKTPYMYITTCMLYRLLPFILHIEATYGAILYTCEGIGRYNIIVLF